MLKQIQENLTTFSFFTYLDCIKKIYIKILHQKISILITNTVHAFIKFVFDLIVNDGRIC